MVSPAIGSALINAAGSIGGGLLGSRGPRETQTQQTQRQLIDQLMSSLKGQGPFSGLFERDEGAFQKSFVDPALQRFRTQTAPEIQQQFISSGLQRGTGLEDALTRAGVDLDTLLNEQFLKFQQGGEQRQADVISSILGAGAGAQPRLTSGEALGQSVGGFLSSPAFSQDIGSILDKFTQKQAQFPTDTLQRRRPGFE